MDAVPIVPPLFWGTKNTTLHELQTGDRSRATDTISKLSWTSSSESSSFHRRATKWSTGALRGTSRHQFLGRRNELSARLEMDRRKGQNGYGRHLRHQTRCDPSGSNLYRRCYRLGSVNHCGADRSRARSSISGSSPEPDGAPTLPTSDV
jgi:hypothetical protein